MGDQRNVIVVATTRRIVKNVTQGAKSYLALTRTITFNPDMVNLITQKWEIAKRLIIRQFFTPGIH